MQKNSGSSMKRAGSRAKHESKLVRVEEERINRRLANASKLTGCSPIQLAMECVLESVRRGKKQLGKRIQAIAEVSGMTPREVCLVAVHLGLVKTT